MGNRLRPIAAAITVAFSGLTWGQTAENIANQTTVLGDIVVRADRERPLPTGTSVGGNQLQSMRASTSDSASLLRDVPGVSLYGAGGTSSLPAIHGLADDRLRISVDGMDLIASCPNHMNPPLSYVDPSNVSELKVYAGITPVSVGGDSIGGTIIAQTKPAEFATAGQGVLTKGEIGTFYRSNGDARGANVSATLATENLSVTYAGSTAKADNFKAAGDFKNFYATGRTGHTLGLSEVGSTAYETNSHTLGFAMRGGNHLVEAKFSYQDTPFQLYPNQRMDMLDNVQKRASLRYLGQFDWGSAELRAYHEQVKHFMEFGEDKKFFYTAGNASQGMPMRTEGKTSGFSAKFNVDLTPQDLLRLGTEYQHYTLNDWWPAVTGSGGMGPNDFLNINDGKRDRAALFGEWEKRLNPNWTSLFGVRYERVTTEAGAVHGYNTSTFPSSPAPVGMMNQNRDAANFNNSDRNKSDDNWDVTALARYNVDATQDIEFGASRKVRSPNLYERYSWSTANMMAIMNNYVGDGNGYVGNPDLKPETAYTASATFDWHAPDRRWEAKATPFYTYVDNYIDAVQWNGTSNSARTTSLNDQFVVLKYANQSARLYGIDLSGRLPLANTGIGEFGLKGKFNYTKGENRDTGGGLYNIMPMNAKLALTHKLGGWDNAVELIAVQGKHDVSAPRNEIQTSGYSLTNLRASYTWQNVRVDFGVENLFDKFYYQPLGGAYTGQGSTMSIALPWGIGVPGMGRSIYAGLNVKF